MSSFWWTFVVKDFRICLICWER